MDGEDLSKYDDVFAEGRDDDDDDVEALDQLEWELASHEGRITGTSNQLNHELETLSSKGSHSPLPPDKQA